MHESRRRCMPLALFIRRRRLDKASTAYGMEINVEKTKLMTNNTSGINTEKKKFAYNRGIFWQVLHNRFSTKSKRNIKVKSTVMIYTIPTFFFSDRFLSPAADVFMPVYIPWAPHTETACINRMSAGAE